MEGATGHRTHYAICYRATRTLECMELWYQSAPTWATVSMAQAIRSRLSAQQAGATLYIIPAEDHVLDRPYKSTLKDSYLAEEILRVPNMNNTGRLPGIAMIHIGMEVRLTVTVEAPDAVVDSTGVIVGFDLDPEETCAPPERDAV